MRGRVRGAVGISLPLVPSPWVGFCLGNGEGGSYLTPTGKKEKDFGSEGDGRMEERKEIGRNWTIKHVGRLHRERVGGTENPGRGG